MGLLTEVMQRLPSQRLVELTNADNPGGIKKQDLAGTVTVTSGSTSVVGAGTAFLSFQGSTPCVIEFDSQPGVPYVVASVQDDTRLTLASAYKWTTTAGTAAHLPAINYDRLQNAVWDAQQHFQERTNFPFDDTTQNSAAVNPGQLNKCFWAGTALVVAFLYDYRGLVFPGSEGAAAWAEADRRLKIVLRTLGDGAWAAPQSDSNFSPSYDLPGSLPDTDKARLGSIIPQDLGGPFGNTGTGGTSDYGGV